MIIIAVTVIPASKITMAIFGLGVIVCADAAASQDSSPPYSGRVRGAHYDCDGGHNRGLASLRSNSSTHNVLDVCGCSDSRGRSSCSPNAETLSLAMR